MTYFFKTVSVCVCLYSTLFPKAFHVTRTHTVIPIKFKRRIGTKENKEENQDQIKENINM